MVNFTCAAGIYYKFLAYSWKWTELYLFPKTVYLSCWGTTTAVYSGWFSVCIGWTLRVMIITVKAWVTTNRKLAEGEIVGVGHCSGTLLILKGQWLHAYAHTPSLSLSSVNGIKPCLFPASLILASEPTAHLALISLACHCFISRLSVFCFSSLTPLSPQYYDNFILFPSHSRFTLDY